MTDPLFIGSEANELSQLVVEEAMRRNTHLASGTAALARDWMSSGGPTTPLFHSLMPSPRGLPAIDQEVHTGSTYQRSQHRGDT